MIYLFLLLFYSLYCSNSIQSTIIILIANCFAFKFPPKSNFKKFQSVTSFQSKIKKMSKTQAEKRIKIDDSGATGIPKVPKKKPTVIKVNFIEIFISNRE